MASSKIELSIGNLRFAGEGETEWLDAQIDKFFERVKTVSVAPSQPPRDANAGGGSDFTSPLASYLKAKNAETNQTQRFLATADWLRRRGLQTLMTAAVSKALADNQQKRLGNPADCLNQNVAKGFCEKTANGFFITPDGLKALGSD